MNDLFYRWGCAAIRLLLRLPVLGPLAARLAAVTARHARLLRVLRAGQFDEVVDGGANIGEFAHLARLALPHARILCVEPHPDNARRLRQAGFDTVEAALWRDEGTLTLTQVTGTSTSCTVLGTAPDHSHGSWSVPSIRLDRLPLTGSRLLIKLDLQGAEWEALQGMGTLWPRCAGLILEMHTGPGGDDEKIASFLADKGFFECGTLHELEENGRAVEADKLWLRTR
jgi:FkbM family methyltransferase